MGANKKEFENERQEREHNEFSNIVKKQKGYMSFKNIINLVNMFPNNTELGQRVREYVASRDNE